MLNWSSATGGDGESAASDTVGSCHESCCSVIGGCEADCASCILGDAAAETGRVAPLTELPDCPSRESDSGTDATATVGILSDCARRSVSDF